ncbi:fasciclin domain-containing protein [Methanocella conradii]|nr:fasciclin domain-containing protein [Methanocella conradii]
MRMDGVRWIPVSLALLFIMMAPAQAQFFDGQIWDRPPGQFMPDMGEFPFPGMGGMMPQREWSVRVRLPTHGAGMSVMDALENARELSIFTAAVKAAGYGEKLRGRGDYLVFAPTDGAIKRDFSISDAQALLSDKDLTRGLLENSIVYKPAGQDRRGNESDLVALSGKEIVMLRSKSGVTANGADVLKILGARNGMVIVTDGAVGT